MHKTMNLLASLQNKFQQKSSNFHGIFSIDISLIVLIARSEIEI